MPTKVTKKDYRPFAADVDGDGADELFWYTPGTGPDYIWTAISRTGTPTSATVDRRRRRHPRRRRLRRQRLRRHLLVLLDLRPTKTDGRHPFALRRESLVAARRYPLDRLRR